MIEMCIIMPIVITVIFVVINMMIVQLNNGIATGEAYHVVCNRERYMSGSGNSAEDTLNQALDQMVRPSMQHLDELETSVRFRPSGNALLSGITGTIDAVIKYEELHPGIGLLTDKKATQRKVKIEKEIRDISNNLRRWQLYGKHYDTDGINVYLMLTDTDYQVSYETKMLQNNCIPYVLPFNVMFIDGDAIPCYEVNGLTEFAVIEQTITITPVLILQLFQELVMVFHQLGRYLLSVNNLILVEDCIFYDIAQKCFGFIYLPGYQSGVREQMRRLLDQVICRMDHADRAGSDRVYDLYQKIMDANCDLEKLVDFLQNSARKKAAIQMVREIQIYIERKKRARLRKRQQNWLHFEKRTKPEEMEEIEPEQDDSTE